MAKTKNEDTSHSLFVGIPSNKPVFAVQRDYRLASAIINELRCFGAIRAAPKDMDRPRHRETLKHELQAFAGWSVVGKHALSARSRGEVVVGSRLPARKSGGRNQKSASLATQTVCRARLIAPARSSASRIETDVTNVRMV